MWNTDNYYKTILRPPHFGHLPSLCGCQKCWSLRGCIVCVTQTKWWFTFSKCYIMFYMFIKYNVCFCLCSSVYLKHLKDDFQSLLTACCLLTTLNYFHCLNCSSISHFWLSSILLQIILFADFSVILFSLSLY